MPLNMDGWQERSQDVGACLELKAGLWGNQAFFSIFFNNFFYLFVPQTRHDNSRFHHYKSKS